MYHTTIVPRFLVHQVMQTRNHQQHHSKGFPVGPWYDSLPSTRGSELQAPVLQAVYTGVTMALSGFRKGVHTTMGSTLELW